MNQVKTIGELVSHMEGYAQERTCCVINEREYVYSDLIREVRALAGFLRKIGVDKGDRVAIWLPNSVEWVVSLLAVGYIGAILVPINTRFQEEEARYILVQSSSKVLICQHTFLKMNYYERVAKWFSGIGDRENIFGSRIETLQSVIWVGNDVPSGTFSWGEATSWHSKFFESDCAETDALLIQYTSGTTSFPKGALLTHCGLIQNAFDVGARMHVNHEDKIFSAGPFFHIGSVTMQVLLSLLFGSTFYTLDYFSPQSGYEMVRKYRCTIYNGIDTLFLLMMEYNGFKKEEFTCVRSGWCTGSPEIVKLIRDKMGIEDILCIYGLSEASPNVTISDIDDPLDKRLFSCGRAHPGCEIAIVNPDTFEFLPPGTQGEIVTRGYNVMLEYFGKPEETKKVLTENGWLRTGDLGIMDQNGFLYFKSRLKEIIRVGGENFSPQEVEGILYEHQAVELVAVVGVSDDIYGQIPVAVIKPREGLKMSLTDVQDFLKTKVSNFKIPKKLVLVNEFPLTESGKIQKFKLLEQIHLVSIPHPVGRT